MAQRPPARKGSPVYWRGTAQNLEILTGALGSLTFFLLVTTIWVEVTGRPAGRLAFLLLLLAVATYVSFRAWRRVLGRPPTPGSGRSRRR